MCVYSCMLVYVVYLLVGSDQCFGIIGGQFTGYG